MKTKDILQLKTGAVIKHRRYGISTVEKVIKAGGSLFGVVIAPNTNDGKDLLLSDSGGVFPRLLEDAPRQILTTEKAGGSK